VFRSAGVTADTSQAVLGEKATRAVLYVAMTRGRESNSAHLYEREAEASEYSDVGPDGLHVLRRGSSRGAARLFRQIIATERAHRPHTNSPPKPAENACQRAWLSCSSTVAPTRCRRGEPPTAICAQRTRSGWPVTNTAPASTYTNRVTTASSCSAGPRSLAWAASQGHVVRSFLTVIKDVDR
jgi:hypothetical protein